MRNNIYLLFLPLCTLSCQGNFAPVAENALKPVVITEVASHDTDDPAIWINPEDATKSLVVGTDKDSDGALYLYDLTGKVIKKSIPLKRPNNVDIAYGMMINNQPTAIAVTTERENNKLRIFSMPGLVPIDGVGIEVFTDETERGPMGVALYTRPSDKKIFAIVGRKSGPKEDYLWQYELIGNPNGMVSARLVRKFGSYSETNEIEAIAVDNSMGFVYYSDEGVGIRKYQADPDKRDNNQLALFGDKDFKEDHEGISIYHTSDSTGYILVSNQQMNSFMVYKREGEKDNPHAHKLVKEIPFSTLESDGSDVSNLSLGVKFPKGMFVAMSNGKVFHFYDWRDIESFLNNTK
ncbi:phytase [Paradesertivirga mongoliensis]|uniref:Phytase n=1 Tax=Paradesertivirga mongoliensis TaxID=2100740 RepID=A0ABW4ZG83_9SPHI|nr:phytase [Pedobacter mongoliensis]